MKPPSNSYSNLSKLSYLGHPSGDEKDVAYIEPTADIELHKEKRQACREIVQEIKSFGVNQRQLLFLIELLALELENGNAMRAIANAVKSSRSQVPLATENKLITPLGSTRPDQSSKLLTPKKGK